MPGLGWLIARPVAHRGLHDAQRGIVENTPSAFAAAVAGRYGIECDLQVSGDGEAMVYHDDTLDRLTEGSGRLDAMTAAALKRVPFKATADRMIALGELCEFVAGRATLVIELKSEFGGDRRLVTRAAKVLSGYRGPAAVMSFDPAPDRGLARDRAAPAARGGRATAPRGGQGRRSHAGAARAPAIHRLFGQGPAGRDAPGGAQSSRPSAPDLDRAQRR